MKIKLFERPKRKNGIILGMRAWKSGFPFIVNPRGVLVHRAREIHTHQRDGKDSHHSTTYWCGNCTCFEIGSEKDVVVEYPPKERLLCSWCEAKAVAAGEPTAAQLVGRHVHVGVLRAVRICCRESDNN